MKLVFRVRVDQVAPKEVVIAEGAMGEMPCPEVNIRNMSELRLKWNISEASMDSLMDKLQELAVKHLIVETIEVVS